MENAYRAIILISGTLMPANAKCARKLMFTTKIEENAYVQTICLSTLDLNACNAQNQVIGIQTKEDVFNVQMNKFMIESEECALHVHKMRLSLKTMNATHALSNHTMIKPE